MNAKDIIKESNVVEMCPSCPDDASGFRAVQCTVDFRKNRFYVRKTMNCPDHGAFTISRQIKTVQMHGRDAQIIPKY